MAARRGGRRGRRVLLVLGLVVLVVVAALPVVGVATVRRSFPQTDGELAVAGLSRPVTVLRDQWGVPQIYAQTDQDLFFAQGYVHAQDRFYEMDFRRHVTAGRLAEMFGASQVPTDRFLRTLGWHRVAEQELDILAPDTVRLLTAYADGVNAWLAEHQGAQASLEYAVLGLQNDYTPDRWTPVDSVAWLKAMAWDLRTNLEDEIDRALLAARLPADRLAQLYPPYPYDEHQPIVTGDAPAALIPAGGVPTPAGEVGPSGDAPLIPADAAGAPTDVVAEPVAGLPGVPDDQLTEAAAALQHAAQSVQRAAEGIQRAASVLGAAGVSAVPGSIGGGADVGSNSWVLAGSRTRSGLPLLANDPHLAPSMPSVWYQVGLHCAPRTDRCPYDVAGFSFSGLPGVIIGHNDRIAWGFTNLGPDVTDLYLEKVENGEVRRGEALVPLTTRTERLDVAGGEPRTLTIRRSRHGPLVSDVDDQMATIGRVAPTPAGRPAPGRGSGYAVALSWTALQPGRTADAIFLMDAARDWEEFRAAASRFEVPAQNLVYADRDGHIGYQAPGTIPIRGAGSGALPAPGWDPRYDWVGRIPYDELPHVLDPPEGYLVTANQAVTGPSYPYHLTADWDYGYRAQRIVDLLEQADQPVGAAEMADIHLDTRNPFAPRLVPALLQVPVGQATERARDLLRDWDFTQPEDSAPAAYYNAVWRALLALTFHDELPRSTWPDGASRWFMVVDQLLDRPDDPWWDDTRTPGTPERRDDILTAALEQAHRELEAELGTDPTSWQWGDLHQLELVHASLGTSGLAPVEALFNRGPVSVGGGSGAVDATGWNPAAGYAVTAVPSMRMVVDFADLDASRWVNLTGASGHAYSDHYGDQIPLWRMGRTTPWPFSRAAVEDAATAHPTLRPR